MTKAIPKATKQIELIRWLEGLQVKDKPEDFVWLDLILMNDGLHLKINGVASEHQACIEDVRALAKILGLTLIPPRATTWRKRNGGTPPLIIDRPY